MAKKATETTATPADNAGEQEPQTIDVAAITKAAVDAATQAASAAVAEAIEPLARRIEGLTQDGDEPAIVGMPTPTVGRIVHYHFNDSSLGRAGVEPHAAIVVGVNGDRSVNVVVFDTYGKIIPVANVTLAQRGDDTPHWHYCSWPFAVEVDVVDESDSDADGE